MTDVSMTGNNAIIDRQGAVQAMAFVLKGGAALNTLLTGIADQKAAERMGSIKAMCFLVQTYSDEEQHAIPVVGLKKEDAGNKPYDRYSKEITTPEGKRMVPGSWYTDVIHAMPEYERIQKTKRWLDGVYEEGEAVPDDIRNIAKTGEATAMKNTLNDRISDMRVGLTKGSMLFHHAELVSAVNPDRIKVKMPWRSQYVLDGDGQKIKIEGTNEHRTELVVYGSKIRLTDPAGEFEDKVYSVSSFLQLKPDNDIFAKLDKAAQTIVSLDATTARPPKAPVTAEGANAAKVPTTLEGGLTLFNALASWMDGETTEGVKVYASLLEACAKAGPEGDETVMSIGKVCLALDALWTNINGRYTRLTEEKARAALASKGEGRTAVH